ncbi:hypothetical protein ABTH99_06825, partial [Acinetobacter baumannii]
MTQHLSKHRHISFTAHYTGYIWYQMGISHEALATSKGKSLAYLVHPLESWAEKYSQTTLLFIQDSKKTRNNSSTESIN